MELTDLEIQLGKLVGLATLGVLGFIAKEVWTMNKRIGVIVYQVEQNKKDIESLKTKGRKNGTIGPNSAGGVDASCLGSPNGR